MKKYLKTDEWNIIEDSFQADRMRWSESIFSLGNGRFGQRGHFEEPYSSDSYRGAFVAGITFLDKTRVGWWKNGFPQFYTRIPNAPDWSSISLRLIDEETDLRIEPNVFQKGEETLSLFRQDRTILQREIVREGEAFGQPRFIVFEPKGRLRRENGTPFDLSRSLRVGIFPVMQ